MSVISRAVSRSLAPTVESPPPLPDAEKETCTSSVIPEVLSTMEVATTPQAPKENPLLTLGLDLTNIDRAERQVRALLRGIQLPPVGLGSLNATQRVNADAAGRAPMSSCAEAASISAKLPISLTASPTTRVPASAAGPIVSSPSIQGTFPQPGPQTSELLGVAGSPHKTLSAQEKEALLLAWDLFSKPVKLLHAALRTPLKFLMIGYEDSATHAPLSASRKAELLSDLCNAAERIALSPSITLHASGSPAQGSPSKRPLSPAASAVASVPMPALSSKDIESCVSVILDALDSPSLVIRLLGLHGAKFLCYDKSFFERFLKQRGFYLVASAIDGEHPQESDYALTLVHSVTRLALKGTLKEHLPYYIIARVVSCIDPLDQRMPPVSQSLPQSTASGTVSFSHKSRCLDMLQLMLKAYPEEMSEADAIRPMLLACLNPSTPKEEMERVVVALLDAFDDPKRRSFIRDSDIGVIFSPFTDHSFREGTMINQHTNQPGATHASPSASSTANSGTVTGRAREMICKFLSSWSGMLWLSTETAGIRSLIDALHLPGRVDLKLSLIALFNQSIRRMAPHRGIPAQGPWDGGNGRNRQGTVLGGGGVADDYELIEFEDGAGFSDSYYHEYLVGVNEGGLGGLGVGIAEHGGDDYAPITSAVGYHACDVFLGCLLLVLNHHGLPDALIAVMRNAAQRDDASGSSGGSSGDGLDPSEQRFGQTGASSPGRVESDSAQQPVSLLREAALLLQHIVVLMDTLLPRATASKLHGSLNEAISTMAADGRSLAGGLTNTLYHNFRGSDGSSIYSSGVVGLGAAGKSLGLGSPGSLIGFGGADTDNSDASFHQLLRESLVLENNGVTVAESSKYWNPVAIMTLIEGPLKNSMRLRLVKDKFLQRLLGFYKLTAGGVQGTGSGLGSHHGTSPMSSPAFGHADTFGPTLSHFNQPMARHHTTLNNGSDCRFRWTAIGVALMDLLLSSRDGVDVLVRVDFVAGFKSLFDDVLNYHQQQSRRGSTVLHTRLSSLLARDSLQEGIGIDILKILARFTLCANGLNLLKKYGIFDRILGIFTLAASPPPTAPAATGAPRPPLAPNATAPNSGQVSPVPSLNLNSGATGASSSGLPGGQHHAELCNLCSKILQYSYVGSVPNFGVCEEFRRMMQIALGPTVEDSSLKNAAIDQLARVIWRDLGGSLEWGVGRLLSLLDDSNRSIVSRSYKLLSNICFSSGQALDNLISKEPRALLENKQLVDQRRMLNINALLYRMVGHPRGFAFLNSMGWVSKELEHWAQQGSLLFVDDLKQVIASAGSDANLNSAHFGGGATPRNTSRHYRTASNAPNYRQALTTVTSSMQAAHSIYPDHVVRGLCCHKAGCEAFSQSRLWLESIQTVMSGVSRKCVGPRPANGDRRSRRLVVGSSDDSQSTTSSDVDSEGEVISRQAAAVASDAAIAARRRRSVADTTASISAALKLHAQKATAHIQIGSSGGQGSSSLIHMLRREAIAEDIDEVLEYEGGAAEIQFQNNQNHRGTGASAHGGHHHHHHGATYYHAGTAGLNTVANYRRSKRKGMRRAALDESSSDDGREFSAARGYESKYGSRMVDFTVDPKVLAAAMYVLAFAGSSDYGFELLIRANGQYPPYALLHKFVEISRYAINPFVRGTAFTCLSIICRSPLAKDYLTTAYSCSVINEPSAYVTPNGIPYSVSFLQPHLVQWMLVGRAQHGSANGRSHHQGTSAYAAQRSPPSTKNVPKDIQEFMMMLLNPVSREKAKTPLVALMKERPSLVVSNASVRYMRECSCIYRMRHAERKFLAELFAKARVVRYTHKKEKRERDALLQQQQQQQGASFGQVNSSSMVAAGASHTNLSASSQCPPAAVQAEDAVTVPQFPSLSSHAVTPPPQSNTVIQLETPPPEGAAQPPRVIGDDI